MVCVIKTTLGVRKTTCSDVCLVEREFLPLTDEITVRRTKFFQEKCNTLPDTAVLKFVLQLVSSINTVSNKLINDMLATRITKSDYYKKHAESVKRNESSKRVTYLSLNPNLIVSSVYRNRFIPIKEFDIHDCVCHLTI